MEGVINMVNGREINEELNRISQFFENLTDDEFQEVIKRCGHGIIKENCQSSYITANANIEPLILPTVNINSLIKHQKKKSNSVDRT